MDTIAFIEALSAVMKKEELHSVKVSSSTFGEVEVKRGCPCITSKACSSALHQSEQKTTKSQDTAVQEERSDPAPPHQTKAYITSPLVGTFYPSLSPGLPPCVKVGDIVREESVVCIVEAMKVMNEVKAGKNGKVTRVAAAPESVVGYGDALFEIEPV